MTLEKMADFFEARLKGYDEHMLCEIEGAKEFYPFTASLLPCATGTRVLDLGCGTGLELEEYFKLCPDATVTGIDLSRAMLDELQRKLPDKDITLLCGSYFDLPLGEKFYDAALSVESLHHFTREEKVMLYKKLYNSLRKGGYFLLTDYFAASVEEEKAFKETLERLKAEQGITDSEFYHFDTPLTLENETNALITAGFLHVEVLKNWGATYVLKAVK